MNTYIYFSSKLLQNNNIKKTKRDTKKQKQQKWSPLTKKKYQSIVWIQVHKHNYKYNCFPYTLETGKRISKRSYRSEVTKHYQHEIDSTNYFTGCWLLLYFFFSLFVFRLNDNYYEIEWWFFLIVLRYISLYKWHQLPI